MARKPQTIRQRLEFEGGEEILALLERIAEGGKKTFDAVKKAIEDTEGPTSKFGKSLEGIKSALERMRGVGTRFFASLQKIAGGLISVATAAVRVARRLALITAGALAASAALIAVARSGAAAADSAAKSAEGLALSITEYTRLKFAAEQSGVGVARFEGAISSLNSRIAEAVKKQTQLGTQLGLHPEQWAQQQQAATLLGAAFDDQAAGGDKASAALKRLDIRLLDIRRNARSPFDILLDLSEAFAKFPDGIEKTGLAVALFGEGLGRHMLPMLNLGREGMQALADESDRLGNTLSENQGKIGTALVVAQGRLATSIRALKDEIGLLFAPALTEAADRQTEAIIRNRKALLDLVNNAIPAGLAIIEDLVAAFQGRDQDVGAQWILDARDAIVAFAGEARIAINTILLPAFEVLLAIFDTVAAGLNNIFGTDFTGRQVLIAAGVAQLLGVFAAFAGILTVVTGLLAAWPAVLAGALVLFETGGLEGVIALFQDLAAVIEGRDADVRSQWILDARDAIVLFAQDAQAAVTDVLIPAFEFLLAMFDTLAEGINAVFGTEFTGRQLLIAAAVLHLVGVFSALSAIVGTVASALVAIVVGGKLIAWLVGVGTVLVKIIAWVARIGLAFALAASWPALLVAALIAVVALVVIFWDDIVALGEKGIDLLVGVFDDIGSALSDVWDSALRTARSFWDSLARLAIGAVNRIISAWRALRALISSTPAQPSPLPAAGFSGGGPVAASATNAPLEGSGTTTSDSILGWLSRKEFVLRARAVAYYGANFMRRLNAMQIPRGALPGFSMGGFIDGLSGGIERSMSSLGGPGPALAFAQGGPVLAPIAASASGRPIVLQLGGREFELTAREDVAEALTRTGLANQRKSAGRKPAWFGGG